MSEPNFPVREMLVKCAEYMEQVVLPSHTDMVKIQKTYLASVALRIMANTVEERSGDLLEENQTMRSVLTNVRGALNKRRTLAGNAARNETIAKLDRALKEAQGSAPNPGAENRILKQGLVDAIKGLDALSDVLPAETMASLKGQIRSALRQQLNHGMAHLEGVPLGF